MRSMTSASSPSLALAECRLGVERVPLLELRIDEFAQFLLVLVLETLPPRSRPE